MTDNTPSVIQKELTKSFKEGSPMQRLFGEVFEELGGISFVTDWAEENPGDFMRLFMAAQPQQGPSNSSTSNVINIHPGLAAGPLDEKVVSDQ